MVLIKQPFDPFKVVLNKHVSFRRVEIWNGKIGLHQGFVPVTHRIATNDPGDVSENYFKPIST